MWLMIRVRDPRSIKYTILYHSWGEICSKAEVWGSDKHRVTCIKAHVCFLPFFSFPDSLLLFTLCEWAIFPLAVNTDDTGQRKVSKEGRNCGMSLRIWRQGCICTDNNSLPPDLSFNTTFPSPLFFTYVQTCRSNRRFSVPLQSKL